MPATKARTTVLFTLVAILALVSSCDAGKAPAGIGETPDGLGPVVVFDLFHRPLPQVPIPIDIAARPDPDSPTGMRINVSEVADTRLESWIRHKADTLDGWGTFTPITVTFECEGDRDGICLDIDNIVRRQHDLPAASGEYASEWPFANDAVYLVNVDPDSSGFGQAVPVDVGQGNYPKYLDRTGYYYPNDPRWDAPTLMFENENEARGEDQDLDGNLDSEEDIDGDGVLDDTEDLDGDGRYDDGTEDLDGDGHLDVLEVDVDGDGNLDVLEVDIDGDGYPDPQNEDIDGDGHLDGDEDIDGDGELDRTEDLDGDGEFDPGEDIDGDGNFDDEDEDTNRDGTLNMGEDIDGDGYLDTGEDVDHDRNLDVNEDLDGDGHLDVLEDIDGDGTFDVQEDLDGDGRWDTDEDTDGDGRLDNIDEDLDGDGSLDTDPGTGEDTDGDGWLDIDEDVNGNGELDGPADTNFDGKVGRANVWCTADQYRAGECHCLGGHECPDIDPDDPEDLERLSWLLDPGWHTTTFYEYENNTLIMRPMRGLEPRTTYAVVLTNRLTGESGRSVRSPFPYINHVDQTRDLEPLEDILAADPHTFGGLTIDGVRFAWTFTTQSTYHDLKILREGLYGVGEFARLAGEYAPEPVMARSWGCNPHAVECGITPEQEAYGFILKTEDLIKILLVYVDDLFGVDPADAAAVLDMYEYVDYFVFGHIWSPNFLDNDGHDEFDDNWEDYRFQSEDLDMDGHFDRHNEDDNFNNVLDEGEDRDNDGHLDNDEDRNGDGSMTVVDQDEGWWIVNTEKGEGKHTDTWVRFFVAVPKQQYKIPGREDEPFPVVFYGHGYTSMMLEGLGFAGSLAKFGLAGGGVDCVHHGLGEDEVFLSALRGVFQVEDLAPLGEFLLDDRARDMNGDGQKDSAGDFWTSYIFHTRDVVRQSALDHYELIRVMRSFDGTKLAQPFDIDRDGSVDSTWDFEHMEPGNAFVVGDYDGDGERDLAGDFNADGEVDFGGPDNWYFAWGQSLGGIMSALMGGAEPSIKGIAPTAGGGGLSDVGLRSTQGGVKEAVILRTIGPILDSRLVGEDDALSECAPGQLSLEFTIPDLNDDVGLEFACADLGEGDNGIAGGDGIVVWNWGNDVRRCARANEDGLFRISFPSDFMDTLKVAIYDGSGGDPFVDYEGCWPRDGLADKRLIETWERFQEFQFWRWSEGEKLVSPAEGYGHFKGTSSLRSFLAIAQLGLEPGDPVNYAPHYFMDPLGSREYTVEPSDRRVNAIIIGTIGDMNVPVNTAAAQGRAAGILDFTTPLERYGGRTQNQVMLDNYVMEANERYGRSYPDDATGTCTSSPCHVLFDLDDIDRGTDGQSVPHLQDPLRAWVPSLAGEYDPEGCGPTDIPDEEIEGLPPDVFDCPGCDIQKCGACYVWSSDAGSRHFLEKVYCPGGVSVYIMPYIESTGTHGFDIPSPEDPFDLNTFMIHSIGLHFFTGGRVYSWQLCQQVESRAENEDDACTWIPLLPPVE